MMTKHNMWIIFFVFVGTVTALENYMDYGIDETSSNNKAANLRDRTVYGYLVQRNADEPDAFRGIAEHLQPRAVERSPSLRLRFGRSYPKHPRSPSLRLRFGRAFSDPVGLPSRLNGDQSSSATFEEN